MSRILTAFIALFAVSLISMPIQGQAAGKGVTTDSNAQQTIEKRRKPRIPGGSGCDDPDDILEHPECR